MTSLYGPSGAAAGPSSLAAPPHLGQTRSRTLLFLSYRDSAAPSSRQRGRYSNRDTGNGGVYFEAPYSDADDPLRASSVNNGDAENQGLLSPRRSREGHVAIRLPSDSASELPPKWMDISDQVDSILASIRPRMDRLGKLHEKHLRPGFADKTAEERQIESLALDITKDFRRCSRLVAGLASFTQHLIRQSKRQAARPGQDDHADSRITVHQIALAQNVQTALATRVQDLSGAFRKQQSLYLRRMKGMEVRDRDIRAARGLASVSSGAGNSDSPSLGSSSKSKEQESAFRDSELAVKEDMELSRQQLSTPSSTNLLLFEEQQQSTSRSDQHIQQRSREIDEIAKSIQELAQLFGDLQTLVIDQGTMLDRIDYNVELMSREMQGAVQELETATRYQRRTGRRQCILFLILLIAVLITLIIVKPFWRFFFTPAPPPPPPSSEPMQSM
ncbi:t-SNARE [Testicularia cyperi]|uniref:t-SNARE n=1 Tax=Testicularia cyperi TaxID=1882483 RepID=A0A317XTH5_9BASI|nr:t-SNARE [Testicularia cyperi]